MKAPMFVIEGLDVTMYDSLADLRGKLESPDINAYAVYDSDGNKYKLKLADRSGANHQLNIFVRVDSIEVDLSCPVPSADELKGHLQNFVLYVTGKLPSGNLSEIVEVTKELLDS